MIAKEELCNKIKDIYPDIGQCGIDVDVEFDKQENTWIVDLRKDHHHLKTFLDESDAEGCVEGNKCVNLGVQIAQLRDNINKV